MEQVFDLREFLIMLVKKARVFIVFALVLGILGALFGFLRKTEDVFTVTSSSSVNLSATVTEAAALTNTMTTVRETITSDFCYNGAYLAIEEAIGTEKCVKLFGSDAQPSVTALKEVIRFYTSGNLILAEATSTDILIATTVSQVSLDYLNARISENINNIVVTPLHQQTANKTEQEGASPLSNAVKFGLVGFIGGIVLALIWVFFFNVMSVKVNSDDDLKKYPYPILGSVSPQPDKPKS